jgi:purine-nucleoside phosphorylase
MSTRHQDSGAQLARAAEFLRGIPGGWPAHAIVLGSGLAEAVDGMTVETRLPYERIPGFPPVTVPGHVGEMVIGRWGGTRVAALRGRYHRYEGHDWDTVVFPVRALALAGTEHFLLTNAAGGLHADMEPPCLVLLTDHLNLMGSNPLIGPNVEALGPRFPDMTEPYDRTMREALLASAKRAGVPMRSGVYVAVTGPSFETAAEIRAFRALGADVVGMSTVPEVIALRHMGKRVAAISCVTNLGAGVLSQPVDHSSVVATARKAKDALAAVVAGALPHFGGNGA